MMLVLCAIIGVGVVCLALVLARRWFVLSVVRRLSGPRAPLMAWRILSGRQLAMMLQEISPSVLLQPSLKEAETMASAIRLHHSKTALAFEQIEQIELVTDFLDGNGLLERLGTTTQVEQKLVDAPIGKLIMPPADHAIYHPFSPPIGPIRLPAEYGPISTVLLSWPTQYPSRWSAHADLAAKISMHSGVTIVVPNAAWARAAYLYLQWAGANSKSLRFICAPSDDIWIRDYGPTLVHTAEGPAFIANPYVPNGLGFHKRDHELPVEIARHFGLPVHRLPLVIEGGNFLSDGAGHLFLTDSVFQHNPDVSFNDLAGIMARWFGAQQITVLPSLPGELTGHVDIALKLCGPRSAWVTATSPGHPWREVLDEIARRMAKTRSVCGSLYEVRRMPMAPAPEGMTERCYCNSLTVNGAILYPSYNPAADAAAEDSFRALDPDVRLAGVDFRDFHVGALHCQTKEVPAL